MRNRPEGTELQVSSLNAALGRAPTAGARLWWLGQAGFLIRGPEASIVIDPYLSDSLATKYRGTRFPHIRMMSPPLSPEDLVGLDAVVVTHGHTDHLDPGTLPGLASANPDAAFVIPASVVSLAAERGVPEAGIVVARASESARVPCSRGSDDAAASAPGGRALSLRAIPSAHEGLATDEEGNHLFLGYVFTIGGVTFYHSGDSVPYPGLVERLRPLGVQVALLPINGRDEYRASNGVPGNFTAGEAFDLADRIGASHLIGHHFGMFDFNTVSTESAEAIFSDRRVGTANAITTVLPELGTCYHFL